MAAAGIGNPAGFVQVFDGGAPRIVTGYARENLSGGVFAFGSTADGVVSSGLNSFVSSDIAFAGDASGNTVNGIVLQYAASGAPVAVATRGVFIVQAYGTVTAGMPQQVNGLNSIQDIATGSLAATLYSIGRALTSTASGGYALLDLNL